MYNINPAKLNLLQQMLCDKLDFVLEKLSVGLRRTSKYYYGPCPVHGGDNPVAINLYYEGDMPGYWRCYTRQCQKKYKATIIGFVRGVLSHQQGRHVSFENTVGWCCDILGCKLVDIKVNYADNEKKAFVKQSSVLGLRPNAGVTGVGRYEIRKRLSIPAQYFVNRGWTPTILDRYDVGTCTDAAKPFFGRAVVPIYNEHGKVAIGFTARATLPLKDNESKWTNSKGFARESHLYNYWFAKQHIRRTGVAVLVEGPPDVWRLEEAGVSVALGMFGCDLTDQQQVLLESSGALSLVLLTDMDDAGRLAAKELKEKLCRLYKIVVPSLPKKDVGELTIEETKQLIRPVVEALYR